MVQLQAVQIALFFFGVILCGALAVKEMRRSQREQAEAINNNWSAAVDSLKAHIDAMELVQRDKETQMQRLIAETSELRGKLLEYEKERTRIYQRNSYLWETCQMLRKMMTKAGLSPPELDGEP